MHYFGSKQELFQRVTHDRPVQELTGTADDVAEQVLARLADSLASEPLQSLALLRSMLTHPEAAQAMREGAARYQAQISRPIAADDAALRAALVSAVMLGVIVSRHLLRTEALSDASPEHVIDLLRPCLLSLTQASSGPPADRPATPRSLSPNSASARRLLCNCLTPACLNPTLSAANEDVSARRVCRILMHLSGNSCAGRHAPVSFADLLARAAGNMNLQMRAGAAVRSGGRGIVRWRPAPPARRPRAGRPDRGGPRWCSDAR